MIDSILDLSGLGYWLSVSLSPYIRINDVPEADIQH